MKIISNDSSFYSFVFKLAMKKISFPCGDMFVCVCLETRD